MIGDRQMLPSLILLFSWNAVVFAAYGSDKHRAQKGQWRLSEKMLLTLSLLCGGIGAYLAGHYFNHKTKKWYFVLSWYMGILITLVLCYYLYQWYIL
ncbi:DUF1294 domain-containing protein [Streptococcus equi]|uniref:DUF1294 domain-containing protein n=1 Tax=Streptococcus equi TaxID=1336 RepID=UPI00396A76B2